MTPRNGRCGGGRLPSPPTTPAPAPAAPRARRLAWLAPWPRGAVARHPIPPAAPAPRATSAAQRWPHLPLLWEEARKLDTIYNRRIAR